jgi:folate-binding protein YgfZ
VLISKYHKIIVVEGKDSIDFLQGQISTDVSKQETEKIDRSAICNLKGRVIASFLCKKISNDQFHLITHQSIVKKLVDTLKKYAVFSKVSIGEGNENVSDYIDDEAWKSSIIDNLDPEIYSENSEKYTPQELGYDKNGRIDFKKGCFTGQEIIARMHYRSRGIFSIARVEIDDTTKSLNEEFTVNDKKVGNIVEYVNGKYLVSGKTKNFDSLKNNTENTGIKSIELN